MLHLHEPALHQQSPLLLEMNLIHAQNHTRQHRSPPVKVYGYDTSC